MTLTSATQGARVTDQEMILIIQANDAPIRFQQVTLSHSSIRLPVITVLFIRIILNIIVYPLKLLASEKGPCSLSDARKITEIHAKNSV